MPSYSHLNRNRMKKQSSSAAYFRVLEAGRQANKYTHFTDNEITGSYHNDKKTDPVLVAVGLMIIVCGIIYLVAF